MSLLDPGFELTLRPMRYPEFYEMYRDAIKNTWTVEEVNFQLDITDLHEKMTDAERHLIKRLVAFFATGDSVVANNLVLNLYKHLNSPEARMYLSRQLYEEALHVQFYLTLLDNYIPDPDERNQAFSAVENIPSIKQKADFCFKWIDSIHDLDKLDTEDKKRQFLLNQVCFAACIEGLFFMGAFSYVYYLRSKGLLPGLASGTNYIFKDEACHMNFAFAAVDVIKRENPELWTEALKSDISEMLEEAVDCEYAFAQDTLHKGVPGMSPQEMKQYLQYVADNHRRRLGIEPVHMVSNPFPFMELQDVQELTNFFERTVSAYQVGVTGEVAFDEEF